MEHPCFSRLGSPDSASLCLSIAQRTSSFWLIRPWPFLARLPRCASSLAIPNRRRLLGCVSACGAFPLRLRRVDGRASRFPRIGSVLFSVTLAGFVVHSIHRGLKPPFGFSAGYANTSHGRQPPINFSISIQVRFNNAVTSHLRLFLKNLLTVWCACNTLGS